MGSPWLSSGQRNAAADPAIQITVLVNLARILAARVDSLRAKVVLRERL
jgi:hypothetical protein